MSATGYHVRLSGADCVLRSGTTPYWHLDFARLMRGINGAEMVGEDVFPPPRPSPDGASVSYSLTDGKGDEILKKSISLRDKAIPGRCLKKLQAAIDQLHIWAEDPRVPMEKREFCRRFRLPDPKKDPDAYRLSGGFFSRRLHVLWGYEKEGSQSFLPKSRISERWDDAAGRQDIAVMCRCGAIRRIFRPRNVVLAVLLAAGVGIGCFFPVKCPLHGCVVGTGAYRYLDRDGRCPKRCALTGCGRHLDAKGKCLAHRCTRCGKMMPTSNGQNGVCDDCFWEIK